MIAYGDIEAEDTRCLTEINFVKVFRLSQLLVEYLLYVQDCLQRSNSTLADGRWGAAPAAAPANYRTTSICVRQPTPQLPHMHAPQPAVTPSCPQQCHSSVITAAVSCRLNAPMPHTHAPPQGCSREGRAGVPLPL